MWNMITDNLKKIRLQIRNAEEAAHRNPGSVLLVAVSKTKSAQAIVEAYQAGQRHFGENYVQEAVAKQRELGAFAMTWHFIGPIQSNKTRLIAGHFDWVHSVDSLKIAKRLSEQRPDFLPPLNICLQVNISDEDSKSGISLAELPELCGQVAQLPRLNLRGVMAIPEPAMDFAAQRQPYRKLYRAVQELELGKPMDAYSYGMSGDLEAAIREGATMVRIGTALFGGRG